MALELKHGLTLHFARHGETIANVERRFQGRNDTPLTERGRDQARIVADILTRSLGGQPTQRFVTSPLPRARTTMEMILNLLHLPPVYNTDARLMEIDLGSWSGLTDAEARALDPAMWDLRVHDKWNVRVPGGGENYAMVAERITAWAKELDRDTVAISHGATLRILRGLFLGLSWKEMSDLDEPQDCVFRYRDGTLTRLEYGEPAPKPV
ncbi:MAG TPA: histidine phosphatase family protein [Micropepsaceae bacterium]|nr:histidine phosphatase family protein [Micropepsaceae bacterium]